MKRILCLCAVLLILASCSKSSVTLTDKTVTSSADSAIIFYTVNLTAPAQSTKVSVKDSTLNLAFTENVALLFTAFAYNQTFSVHLLQDFSTSSLANLNYSLTTNSGVTYYNFADDNLNNVDQKTVTDTTINGTAMVKVRVVRTFNFVKHFANIALATTAKTSTLNITTDKVTFSSYVFFDITYPSTVVSAKIIYTQ